MQERPIVIIGAKELLELCKQIDYSEGKFHYGTIGSGDVWNNEIDKISWLNEKYQTLCEDMESIAIYEIANKFKIPVIGIRIISNNHILNQSFNPQTCITCQKIVYQFTTKLIEKIKLNNQEKNISSNEAIVL